MFHSENRQLIAENNFSQWTSGWPIDPKLPHVCQFIYMVDYITCLHCQQMFCWQNQFCNVPLKTIWLNIRIVQLMHTINAYLNWNEIRVTFMKGQMLWRVTDSKLWVLSGEWYDVRMTRMWTHCPLIVCDSTFLVSKNILPTVNINFQINIQFNVIKEKFAFELDAVCY